MLERMEAVDGNMIVLEQALETLRLLDDVTFASGGAAPGVSPVGVHFRHVFFTELDMLVEGNVCHVGGDSQREPIL